MTREHLARVQRAAYETQQNITEITIIVTGEHDITRGGYLTITKEDNK